VDKRCVARWVGRETQRAGEVGVSAVVLLGGIFKFIFLAGWRSMGTSFEGDSHTLIIHIATEPRCEGLRAKPITPATRKLVV